MKSCKVFIALSGGVDSSVAAALLRGRGFDVHGVHIKMWSDPSIPCTTKEDRYDAMRVAAHLGIKFETWDLTEEYKSFVVDYMIREYTAGRTPNPDVMCNSRIKFGVFLKRALEAGADYIATGHYVHLMRKSQNTNSPPAPRLWRAGKSQTNPKTQIPRLRQGFGEQANHKLLIAKDTNKDQSYFLWTLTQEQLKHCLFPIGEYTKPEVRELARKYGLPTAEKKDSQGLCFVGKIDMREFLKNYISERRGAVVTTSGKRIGEHSGLEFFTMGQRRGIAIGGGTPYFVAEKDFATNTLVVAESNSDVKMMRNSLTAEGLNWISGKEPGFPLRCQARIRYRQPLQSAVVARIATNSDTKNHEIIRGTSCLCSCKFSVRFEEPQRAVAPGQSIVLYQNAEMLGGGIIRD